LPHGFLPSVIAIFNREDERNIMYDESLVPCELGMWARGICSGIFLDGHSDYYAFKNFNGPSKLLDKLVCDVDRNNQRVTLAFQGAMRTAQFVGDQGSVVLPLGKNKILFTPVKVTPSLPNADRQNWPTGDVEMTNAPRPSVIQRAIDISFADPRNFTEAVVVVHKGLIIGERYSPGITKDTLLASWSMGKSLLATLFSRLILEGVYHLDQYAPVPEWQSANDPRRKIRIRDLLQMSGGLQFTSPTDKDPDYSSANGYPDHMLAYTEGIDIHEFCRSKKFDLSTPKRLGRYRNCDPWVIGSLLKDAVMKKRGVEYLVYPQQELFDRIGIRRHVLETDPYGNLIFTGCNFGTARNWARLGLLYLQKGMWNNERILPEGWTDFVSSPAPAWKNNNYGGLFWLNRNSDFKMLPLDTYYASGAGGQYTFIIPKHDLVVVRMGQLHEMSVIDKLPDKKVMMASESSTKQMLKMLMIAIQELETLKS